MSKQTAVEYLIQYIMNNQYFIGNDLADVFVKAKEIEREQIIDAFWEGGDNIQQAELYYNETYKGGEQ